jgi:hypothetical protein
MPQTKTKAEAAKPVTPTSATPARGVHLSQNDVPGYSLEDAIQVIVAIGDNYAGKPTRPLDVAAALGMPPSSTRFRMTAGAALAYGLTTGGAFAPEIGLTPLGARIVRPVVEGDDIAAKREALLKPRVVGEFLRKYDNAPLPSDAIAKNVLQEAGVPQERLAKVLQFILDSATAVGFLREIGNKRYVDLAGTQLTTPRADVSPTQEVQPTLLPPQRTVPLSPQASAVAVAVSPAVYVNIEIHIAADASSATIEDIFKNMRRYVLNSSEHTENDAANSD